MTASRSPAQASNESGSVKNNGYICHNSHISLNYNHGQAKMINLQNSNVQCEFAVHATQLQCVNARGGLSAWTMINHKKHFLSVVSLNKHVKNGPELICPWLQCHWGKLVCFIKWQSWRLEVLVRVKHWRGFGFRKGCIILTVDQWTDWK